MEGMQMQTLCLCDVICIIYIWILYNRDTMSGDSRAPRRRLRPKETMYEFYDRAAKKWIYLEEDDPRVANPRKKQSSDRNTARLIDLVGSDGDSEYGESNGDSDSSNFNSSSTRTSAEASHSRSRHRPADKRYPLRSGQVPMRVEPEQAPSRSSSSGSNGFRGSNWTTADDDQLRAIVLQNGARKWKHVLYLANNILESIDQR